MSRRPRVVVLADWWWPEVVGGAERADRDAALALARFADVSVLVPAAAAAVYSDGPLTVHAVRRPFARRVHADTKTRRGAEFLTSWLVAATTWRMTRTINKLAPDVIVAGNISRTGPWLLRWAKRRHIKFVRVFHDLSDTCWRRSRLKASGACHEVCRDCRIKTRIMRNATPPAMVGVCVSEFLRAELVRAELVRLDRSVVAYPLAGVDLRHEPKEGTGGAGIAGGRTVIGYLGRLDPVKGIELAICTVAAYQRDSGRQVCLIVAGEGRPAYVRRLRDLAAAEAVAVEFAGWMEVEEFCARVDVVLIPSTWLEPFGRVAVEVGARGTPMLVSRVGGLPEAAALSGGPHAFTDFQDPQAAGRDLAALLDGGPTAAIGPAPDASPVTLEEGLAAAVHSLLDVDRGRGRTGVVP